MRHRVTQGEDSTRYSSAPDPILTGLNRMAAKRVLDRHGYDAKVVGTGKRVVSQTVNENATQLRVSDSTLKGKRVQTPDVMGFPLRQAIYQLTAAGLNVKTSGSGEVVRQTPAPGTAVGPGTICKLTCASEKG